MAALDAGAHVGAADATAVSASVHPRVATAATSERVIVRKTYPLPEMDLPRPPPWASAAKVALGGGLARHLRHTMPAAIGREERSEGAGRGDHRGADRRRPARAHADP